MKKILYKNNQKPKKERKSSGWLFKDLKHFQNRKEKRAEKRRKVQA